MSVIKELKERDVENILKVYQYEHNLSYVLKLFSITSSSFFLSLKNFPMLEEEFNDITQYISYDVEESVFDFVHKNKVFNATTYNLMMRGRNKKRYSDQKEEEVDNRIDEIDDKLEKLLGKSVK